MRVHKIKTVFRNLKVCIFKISHMINARRACAQGVSTQFVCLSVCYQSPRFFSSLYDKIYLLACFSTVRSGDRALSRLFCVSSHNERLRILLVVSNRHVTDLLIVFLSTQQIRSIVDGVASGSSE